MNSQITEVKQSSPRIILRWVTIQDPYILSFYQFGYDWQNYLANLPNLPNYTNRLEFPKNSINLIRSSKCECFIIVYMHGNF